MIPFNFKLMVRLTRELFLARKDSLAKMTPRRILAISCMTFFYVTSCCVNGVCLLLDEILFRGYRGVFCRAPVFVVGPPRSGTTFLHRLLARDGQFTAIRLWEILFAPSVFQKKAFFALARLDRRLGGPMERFILKMGKEQMSNPMHQGTLLDPEEDEGMLLHIFSSGIFLMFMFPFEEFLAPLIRFDLELPREERLRIMGFYKACVQRHLFAWGEDRRFLSKNPAFSTKVGTLKEVFPDAKVVVLIRNPLESVPSSLSLQDFFSDFFFFPKDPKPFREFRMRMLREYFLYPLETVERWPEDSHAVVLYHTLVADPAGTVRGLYERLGLPLSREYERTLATLEERSRTYKSTHSYSPEKFGLTEEAIRDFYREVYERFDFP